MGQLADVYITTGKRGFIDLIGKFRLANAHQHPY